MTYWTDSTANLEIYFGGLSHQHFTTPLADGNLWTSTSIDNTRMGYFHAQVTSADYGFAFYSRTGEADSFKRMVGCTLLSVLPEPVLNEALSDISERYKFYREDLELEPVKPLALLGEGFALSDEPFEYAP